MAIHERVWEEQKAWQGDQPPGYAGSQRVFQAPIWKPIATYWMLGIMLGVFVLQNMVAATGNVGLYLYLFTIGPAWLAQPWSLVTSTFSHGGISHILLNGLVLFFFGPSLERIVGRQKYVLLFIAAGAVSGLAQILLDPGPALGASGAIMMVFGCLAYLMPKQKILIYGIIPVPFWAAAIGYALLDIVGALGPDNGIGNFAHLSGMALGLWLGWITKRDLDRRGLRLG